MSTTTAPTPTPPAITVGGIPIVWFVLLCCSVIVIGVCALTYPIILLNRWRLKEKIRADNEEEEEDEEEKYEPEPKGKKRKERLAGGSIFGRGRASTRGKWVERMDPATNQPYFEHTGTGEVTWTDPRPQKMRNQKKVNNNGAPGNLVVAAMPGMPMGAYGAPGGFGGPGPRPPMMGGPPMMQGPPMAGPPMMAHTGSMGHMPHTGSMGHMVPPAMARGPAPGFPPGQPPPQMAAPGGAPPGMVATNSMRRTQAAPAPPAPAPAAPAPAPAPAAPAADPKFDKYSRMQKAGLPEGAIRNAMNRDGLSEAEQKAFFGS